MSKVKKNGSMWNPAWRLDLRFVSLLLWILFQKIIMKYYCQVEDKFFMLSFGTCKQKA